MMTLIYSYWVYIYTYIPLFRWGWGWWGSTRFKLDFLDGNSLIQAGLASGATWIFKGITWFPPALGVRYLVVDLYQVDDFVPGSIQSKNKVQLGTDASSSDTVASAGVFS